MLIYADLNRVNGDLKASAEKQEKVDKKGKRRDDEVMRRRKSTLFRVIGLTAVL